MRNLLKHTLLLLLCAFFLLPFFCFAAAAETEPYVQWTLSKDCQRIDGNGKTYTFYWDDEKGAIAINPATRYYFANTIPFRPINSDGEYVEATLISDNQHGEWLWVKSEKYGNYIYATKEGKKLLNGLLEGDVATYLIVDADWNRALTGAKTLSTLQAHVGASDVKKQMLSGKSLADTPYYFIAGTDRTNSFLMRFGIVFKLTDGYYYLDLEGSRYGNQDDVFETSAMVTLYQLREDTAASFQKDLKGLAPLKITFLDENANWEDDYYGDDEPIDYDEMEKNSVVAFKVLFVIFAILLPILPLVFGLVLPRSGKLKRPVHWYALALSSALWLLCAIATFIAIMLI
ncbi:MAG: hypothetical protein E7624_02205 [Ruminococcaceae bacterium]|nr:hypothetical protein [Oscillospiraceae bacterium]